MLITELNCNPFQAHVMPGPWAEELLEAKAFMTAYHELQSHDEQLRQIEAAKTAGDQPPQRPHGGMFDRVEEAIQDRAKSKLKERRERGL